MSHIHHEVDLEDCNGRKYRVKCIEVPFITEVQDQPNLKKVYKLFPSIPKGSLKRPNMEVGILLGQNANTLLPTGGTGEHKVDHLRIRRTILGEHGYILEGYHPDIWRPEVGRSKINLLRKISKWDSAFPEALSPGLSDMLMEIP